MFLILFVLHDPARLEEVLDAWETAGVGGVTVLSSSGLGRMRRQHGIRDDLPVLPSLADFFSREENLNRTLFTTVRNQAAVDRIVAATRSVIGDLDQPDSGLLIVLPVSRAYGLQKRTRAVDG